MSKKKIKEQFHPFNLVVFGGTGDLATRKIFPALYMRFIDGQLPSDFGIVAHSREEVSKSSFRQALQEKVAALANGKFSEQKFEEFLEYFELLVLQENSVEKYAPLKVLLEKNPKRRSIFYYSTPSSAFGAISDALNGSGLIDGHSKVVLEKPLGYDLKSSGDINDHILKSFNESQIYRIDHYLGKETVQNLMVLRFANDLFERAWGSDDIDNIQITVAESIGVEKRAGYYDNSGALRDMVQNHLLQLLCLVAMEPPVSLDANNVRDEKLKVLKALRPFSAESIRTDTVRGQYTRGRVDGQEVNSYLEDLKQYDSTTETFVALKAYVDNWRWKDVPFFLRTGKRMSQRYSDIVINFKPVRHNIFPSDEKMQGNQLIIRLQPEERIELVQMSKVPGPGGYRYRPVKLTLDLVDEFGIDDFPDAYERLIMDVIRGNQTLFMRYDELSSAWEWTESVLKQWAAAEMSNELYKAGTMGPGDEILDEGVSWSNNLEETDK